MATVIVTAARLAMGTVIVTAMVTVMATAARPATAWLMVTAARPAMATMMVAGPGRATAAAPGPAAIMPDRRRRASPDRIAAKARSRYLADRLGRALRESRRALGASQAAAAERAGVSQSFWSVLERGGAGTASLETLTACAAAVGAQLAMFAEARPGSELPRDIEHLHRQELVLRIARAGGWRATPEHPIDLEAWRSRSIDVFLERDRDGTRETVVVEIEDFLADVGSTFRGLADKVMGVRRTAGSDPGRVAGLLIVRRTNRNRAIVAELGEIFATRFPAPSRGWLAALTTTSKPMPLVDGWLWSATDASRLAIPRPVGRSAR